ncbi:MAG TPA: alpha/beta hydrolase, partial [Anaerolineales bacterium]|nr:alpha/beta hydrolase [Anaerolineales bacterium]
EVDIEAAKTDANAVVQSVRYVMGHNLLDVLDDLDIPVLLVCGREDPIIQPPEDSVLEGLEINIYPFVFETAQHYPMLEETSKFDRLLRDFLVHKDNWDEIEVKDEWKRRMR